MQRFYAHWFDAAPPESKAEALRLAQQDLQRIHRVMSRFGPFLRAP